MSTHRKYAVTFTGETPLLMHPHNPDWMESMKRWEKDGANKAASVKGDDRSPAFRWVGLLYNEQGFVVVPSDMLMTVLREGGKRCPTGKGMQTFKSQTQSGIMVDQSAWRVVVDGKEIPYGPFFEMAERKESNFAKHQALAEEHGFTLFIKGVNVQGKKHIRVRPRFDRWSLSGSLTVFDEQITMEVLSDVLKFAGAYAGIGDWRPSSPKAPGSFGKFSVALKEL